MVDEAKVMKENGSEDIEVEEGVKENGEVKEGVENSEVMESGGMPKPNLAQLMKPLFEDPSLPEGWKRVVVQRTGGASAGHWDVYIHGMGKRFRSRPDLERYLEEKKITVIKAEDIDFTVWGKGAKAARTPRTPRTPKIKTPKIPKEKKISENKTNAKKSIEDPLGFCVKMKFNFKKRKLEEGDETERKEEEKERRRHDSELSIDLEELENHPYNPCTPSPQNIASEDSRRP